MKKLPPPTPLRPACPEGYERVHLIAEPEGKHALYEKEESVMLFVPSEHRERFLALVRDRGGLHYGFRENNIVLREMLEEEGIVVLDEFLDVWTG